MAVGCFKALSVFAKDWPLGLWGIKDLKKCCEQFQLSRSPVQAAMGCSPQDAVFGIVEKEA